MPPDILTTLPIREPIWTARTVCVDRRKLTRSALVRSIVSAASDFSAVVVNGASGFSETYSDLFAAAAIARRRLEAPIVVSECTWKKGRSALRHHARRTASHLIDSPRTYFCVLSHEDRDAAARQWGLNIDRIFVTPYCYTLTQEAIAGPVTSDGGVFAGGNSMRDYAPLLTAARGLNLPVTLATRRVSPKEVSDNVRAGTVTHQEFIAQLRSAGVVVVPLEARSDRSAGQQTYLNAMALGKLVIVTDTLGVREYVDDGRTGILVPAGDADAMGRALRWVLEPANADPVDRIRLEGREVALRRFGPDAYARALLAVVDEGLERVKRQRRLPRYPYSSYLRSTVGSPPTVGGPSEASAGGSPALRRAS